MKKTTYRGPGIIAISLLLAILMVAGSTVAAATGVNILSAMPAGQSVHEKIDISEITGEIVEPPQLTSAASAIAAEKAWYEYVYYSPEPVAYYYLNDNTRISFYDPYDYASALVMEVDDSITDWSSNNSMQVSYTTGSSLTNTEGKSTDTTSSVQIADGQDVSETNTDEGKVVTTVEGNVNTYNWSKKGETTSHQETDDETWTVSEQLMGEVETTSETATGIGSDFIGVKGNVSVGISVKGGVNITNTNNFGLVKTDTTTKQLEDDYSHGYTEDNTTTTSKTDAGHSETVTTIAQRLSRAVGSSQSTSISMTTNNSTTITKTYNAGYFNASGAPLQWKIIKYTVKMPMKFQAEYLIDDEWIFGDYNYCLLTTIQGTCRAWMQNNVAYYEHWGTGEPVTWDEFWAQFFTEESLIAAYKNKLYPDN